MAFNQGFYNLFLAIGIVAGLALVAAGQVEAGRAVVLFACASMVGAGAVLLATNRRFLIGSSIQAVPPLVAIVAAVLALRALAGQEDVAVGESPAESPPLDHGQHRDGQVIGPDQGQGGIVDPVGEGHQLDDGRRELFGHRPVLGLGALLEQLPAMALARRQLGDGRLARLLELAQAVERAQRLLAQAPRTDGLRHPHPSVATPLDHPRPPTHRVGRRPLARPSCTHGIGRAGGPTPRGAARSAANRRMSSV